MNIHQLEDTVIGWYQQFLLDAVHSNWTDVAQFWDSNYGSNIRL